MACFPLLCAIASALHLAIGGGRRKSCVPAEAGTTPHTSGRTLGGSSSLPQVTHRTAKQNRPPHQILLAFTPVTVVTGTHHPHQVGVPVSAALTHTRLAWPILWSEGGWGYYTHSST